MTGTGIVLPASFGLSVVTDPPLKFQWCQKKLSLPHQAISNDQSLMSNTTEVIQYKLGATMGVKSVETLSSKIQFSSVLDTFSPLPHETMLTAQTTAPTQHWIWGAGGIRDLTLDANKLEEMLEYWKASFPDNVSTTFVAHCSLIIYESLVRSQSIVHSIKF